MLFCYLLEFGGSFSCYYDWVTGERIIVVVDLVFVWVW